MLLALLFMLAVAIMSRSWQVSIVTPIAERVVIQVNEIPMTRQGVRRPPPPKPALPIPSEEDIIPDDATIEPTTLDLTVASTEEPGEVGGGISQPRPLAFVFPQYPEEERKKGVRGVVKVSLEINEEGRVASAMVIENTTGSALCADAALRAALATRFRPARDANGPVTSWLILPYRFDYRR